MQITESLKPTSLQIHNDSHKHSHHQAMKGVTSREVGIALYIAWINWLTTCRRTSGMQLNGWSRSTLVTNKPSLVITSSGFNGKTQLARHRLVNTLMKDELAQEGGIHALQLTTRTPEEEETKKEKEATIDA